MTQKDDLKEKDLEQEIMEEIAEIEEEKPVEEVTEESVEKNNLNKESEVDKLKEALLRQQADYENFKRRTERDKQDMVFFLKSKILKPILSRVDDLERILKNTPEEMRVSSLFEWVISLEKALKKDLQSMWVKEFVSIWEEIDPNKHEIMTQIPWKEGFVIDEFEKWYMLDEKILRVAKVVSWSWE